MPPALSHTNLLQMILNYLLIVLDSSVLSSEAHSLALPHSASITGLYSQVSISSFNNDNN